MYSFHMNRYSHLFICEAKMIHKLCTECNMMIYVNVCN